ncbi:hypothetical protein ACJIZ3_011182 [Penstemon smallii]|uniref:DOG1 domain-containing protein n=1 Tax=Penstemon smallii TaxID=265156 RepID=A0ABD3UJX2_9LAMI
MNFHRFYNTWTDELHQLVNQLNQSQNPPITAEHHHHLRQLVQKTLSHFIDYYKVKSAAAKHDVMSFFEAQWISALERSLQWIGGWRPTSAFHLVYTESSILFETHLVDILRGVRTGDLGDLSPGQFRQVSELQCQTVKQENVITDELSEWQACMLIINFERILVLIP